MTEKNFPWSGTSPGKAGPYTAETFRQFMRDVVGSNSRADGGVVVGTNNGADTGLEVQETSPQTRGVRIRTGSAFVYGGWFNTDELPLITLGISENNDGSGFDRVDLVVLRSNSTTQVITPVVLEGTPAASPVAPTPTKSGAIYEIPLAEVLAQNLFATITDADIDNSVREYSILRQPQEGGTGLAGGYVAGDVIVAQGVNDLTVQNLADYETLVRDPSQANDFGVGNLTDAVAYYDEPYGTNGAVLTSATWNTIPFDNLQDPAGIFTSLVAGVFTVNETGRYYLNNFECGQRRTGAGTAFWQFRLYNVTQATVIEVGPGWSLIGAGASYELGARSPMQGIEFGVTAADVIELQAWSSAGSTDYGLALSATINAVQQPEIYAWCSFRRVQ